MNELYELASTSSAAPTKNYGVPEELDVTSLIGLSDALGDTMCK